jgi:hypothetical protein
LLDVQTPECFICNHAKTILKLEEEVQWTKEVILLSRIFHYFFQDFQKMK